ncbi:MAG: glycosyltransferase [Phycisphaeraceae bacterium]|nr:glycosyltransferase [Phycisphaeraceae bacterium]
MGKPTQAASESAAETSAKPSTRPDAGGAAGTRRNEPLLVEVSWEVCNQVGGIYQVLRSKVPSMVARWGNRYCLVGPYQGHTASIEFEPAPLVGPFGQAVKQLHEAGIGAQFGRWLVTGRPHVVLLHHGDVWSRLHEVKYRIWADHGIALPPNDSIINDCSAFAEAVRQFLWLLAKRQSGRRRLVAHFHEWMGGIAIPMLRHDQWPGATVFTTHATQLGRYLAMHDLQFYQHLGAFNPTVEAKRYNVEAHHGLERAAAHGAHVFTTVSDVTAQECRHLLGRAPDVLLPNGLNIQRFAAVHEFQNLHSKYKEKIHQFTMGHFFPSYHFDLDKTLYIFTSGRYEYRNKGMDLTIEALARLNWRMRQSNVDRTVVAFLVTRRPFKSISVGALQSSAMLDEFRVIGEAFQEQIGQRMLSAAAQGRIPDLNTLVDDYWRLRLRRAIQAWKRNYLPPIVTHDLQDDQHDEVLNQLRTCRLWNHADDRVKVVYHPDFISTTSPLFGLEYEQFVRGCHLGVFPSYYEPWGYTPLESIALGVPAITSDLSGFGSYLIQLLPDHEEKGLYVLRRRDADFHQAAEQLGDLMFRFTQLNRRERIALRNNVESFSEHFDWHNLGRRYHEAHGLALDRLV